MVNPTIQANALQCKGVPSKQYIGVDFSQTSYIGFEFPAKPSVCPRAKIAGTTNLAEEPCNTYNFFESLNLEITQSELRPCTVRTWRSFSSPTGFFGRFRLSWTKKSILKSHHSMLCYTLLLVPTFCQFYL